MAPMWKEATLGEVFIGLENAMGLIRGSIQAIRVTDDAGRVATLRRDPLENDFRVEALVELPKPNPEGRKKAIDFWRGR